MNKLVRIKWIDVARGIGILSVIIGHCSAHSFGNILYSYHMPLFLILTGFTIKRLDKYSFLSGIWKDFKRLYIPVIITLFIDFTFKRIKYIFFGKGLYISFYQLLLSIFWGNENSTDKFMGIGPLWFLVCLFFSKFLIHFLLLVSKNLRLIFIILLLGTSFFASLHIEIIQSLDIVFVCSLFIFIGYLFRSINVIENISFFEVFLLILFWGFFLFNDNVIYIASRRIFIEAIIEGTIGSILIIKFSMFCSKYTYFSDFLSWIGKNSLLLLCIHSLDGHFGVIWFSFVVNILNFPEELTFFSRIILDLFVLKCISFFKVKINWEEILK